MSVSEAMVPIWPGRRPYSIGNRERLIPYDPDLIDWFFIVDGDLAIYVIPSRVLAGRVRVLLRTYSKYIVGNAAGLMGKSERPARGVTDRQAAGYRNDRPMALKRAVGGARAATAAAGCALVALAQPAVSATGTAVAASTIVSRLDAIMPIRRAPARPGSRLHPRSQAGAPGRDAADAWC